MIYDSELAAMLDEHELLHVAENVLGLCGCGRPHMILKLLCDVLALMARLQEDRADGWYERRKAAFEAVIGAPYDSPATELVLHHMDHVKLTEHGGGVMGSWASELGKQLLCASMRFHGDDEAKWERFADALASARHEALNPSDREARLKGGERVQIP